MKFIVQVLAILLIGHLVALWIPLPWYSIAFVAFVFGYLLKSRANFLAGFLGVALAWLLRIWITTSASDSELSAQVAEIFPVKKEIWLALITVTLGGLVGGLSALTGSLLKPSRKRSYYS